ASTTGRAATLSARSSPSNPLERADSTPTEQAPQDAVNGALDLADDQRRFDPNDAISFASLRP
ncbi:MAG: hypothetical protein ABIQ16_28675, partial [Polyangiaceae bacterium]